MVRRRDPKEPVQLDTVQSLKHTTERRFDFGNDGNEIFGVFYERCLLAQYRTWVVLEPIRDILNYTFLGQRIGFEKRMVSHKFIYGLAA